MNMQKDQTDILTRGSTFEKYTVEKLLGKGGMGAVYLVRHNILDSLFALKVLFPEVAAKNRQFVDRFIREAKLACKIKHPNLIAVHDAGENKENGMYYLVMDYVSGGNIRDLLKSRGRFQQGHALTVIKQIASALNEAHKYKMVHRDIKPDNIMFTDTGVAKLADLGIAKSANEQDTMLTVDASVFGTPAYMSPEQALDSSKVDCRADIYSLGIVLFEMLTGQRPYKGNSTIEILSQVVKDVNIPDVRELCPEISEKVALLIQDMTAKQLEYRLATPAALLKRLENIGNIPVDANPLSNGKAAGSLQQTAVTLPLPELSGKSAEVPTLPTIVSAAADITSQGTIPTIENVAANSNDCKVETVVDPQVTNTVGMKAATIPEKPLNTTTDTGQTKAHCSPVPDQVKKDSMLQTLQQENLFDAGSQNAKSLSSGRITNKKMVVLCVLAIVFFILVCFIFTMKKHPEQSPEKPVPLAQEQPSQKPQTVTNPKTSQAPTSAEKKTEEQQVNAGTSGSSGETAPTSAEKKTEEQQVNAGTSGSSGETAPTSAKEKPEEDAENDDDLPAEADDDLPAEAVVILGSSTSSYLADDKSTGDRIIFREAETYSRYRNQLKEIIKSKPKCVVLIPSARYAELNMSLANFENLISEEANMLKDNKILFMFVLAETNSESSKTESFNQALKDLCNLRSYPLITNEKDTIKEVQLLLNSPN